MMGIGEGSAMDMRRELKGLTWPGCGLTRVGVRVGIKY